MYDINQPSLFEMPIDASRQAAIDLIKHYVLRGDSVKNLKSGQMGQSSPDGMWAQIGGWMDEKRYTSDNILVYEDINGKKVNKTFKLLEIFNLIKRKQL